MIDDERYLKGKFDSGTTSAINTGNATSTIRNLYYKEPRDEDYIKFIDVVWCKDCRLSTVTELKELYCYWLEDIVGAEDYCSKGERREDGNNR